MCWRGKKKRSKSSTTRMQASFVGPASDNVCFLGHLIEIKASASLRARHKMEFTRKCSLRTPLHMDCAQYQYITRQQSEIPQLQIKLNPVNDDERYGGFPFLPASLRPCPMCQPDAKWSLLPIWWLLHWGGYQGLLLLLRLCQRDSYSEAVWSFAWWTS